MTYPKWWDKTVTLYNRHEDNSGRVTWCRKIIKGCFVKTVPMLVLAQGVGVQKSQNIIRLRKTADYLSPIEWKTSIEKTKKFTLQNGDIVVIGTAYDDINEYSQEQRSADLLKKYGNNAFLILSASVNDYGSKPHYKVTG